MQHPVPEPDGLRTTPIPDPRLAATERVAIPDHELIRCVGYGSYGEVWLAKNMMGRYRAIKIVFKSRFKDQHSFERELTGIQKFERVSRTHEGFVAVLHAGRNEEQGYLFYIMEVGDDVKTGQNIDPHNYIPKTLSTEIKTHERLMFGECLRLGLALSSALNHLHNQGLVHRDVKPANIIFVNGVPKLADIGLVTEIENARSYVGTEGFIPPEGPGTPQADVYSLGKLLYELTTGKDRQAFPELPSRLDERPDATQFLELNEVIITACHHDVSKRYQTALDMHADLAVLENGKSIKRLRLLERRWVNFKKTSLTVSGILLIASLATFQVNQRRKELAEARQRQVGSQVAYGTRAMEEGNLTDSLPHLVEALRLDQDDPNHSETHRLRLGAISAHCPKLVQMWFQGKRINDVRFSPDGNFILATGWLGAAQALNAATGLAASPAFGPKSGSVSASFSPDGKLALTASESGIASVWQIDTGNEILTLQHPSAVLGAEFSPSGRYIVTACKDKIGRIWDAVSGVLMHKLVAHTDSVIHAEFSRDEQFVATTSRDQTALLWNARTGEKIGHPLQHNGWVYWASFNPAGTYLVTASSDHLARLWLVPSGQEIPIEMTHGDAVRSAAFSPDGRYIVTASLDATVRLWDGNSGFPVSRNGILNHSSRVTQATFSRDGHRIVTSCIDGSIRIWDLAANVIQPRLLSGLISSDGRFYVRGTNHDIVVETVIPSASPPRRITVPGLIKEVALNQNGSFVSAIQVTTNQHGGEERRLGMWNALSGQPFSPPLSLTNGLVNLRLSNDGQRLAVMVDSLVRIIDASTGMDTIPPLSHGERVTRVCFDNATKLLLTSSGNHVHLWDIRSGKEQFSRLDFAAGVSHIAFSPDGRLFLTCVADENLNERSAQLWNTVTGQQVGPHLSHRDGVIYASFSPDGRRVVTASEDFTAAVWDVATGKQLTPVLKHGGQVQSASFDPDGRWVVTASADKTVRVWDAQTGEPLTPPLEHSFFFQRACFASDSSALVTTRGNGETWVWPLPRDRHRIDDMPLFANLLSGSRSSPDENGTSNLQAAWNGLKSKYPEEFQANTSDVTAWHLRQADRAEKKRQWFTACFHLTQLLAISPENPTLAERLTKAQRALDREMHEIATKQ
jgi:WD40 repeat protein/serine/threonine protein kinase